MPCQIRRVVLTTVTHLNAYVLRIHLVGQAEPLEPTNTHRLYSEDRGAWVHAGELTVGEHLRTLTGPAEITQIASRPGVHRVYNLEVETEHCYYVSTAGVLSHNTNPCARPFRPRSQYHKGVWFDENGFPDFGHVVKHDVPITPTKTRPGDFKVANIAAGHPEWGNQPPPGFTWHHHQDYGRMQLVPRDIHRSVGHDGGWSIWGGGAG